MRTEESKRAHADYMRRWRQRRVAQGLRVNYHKYTYEDQRRSHLQRFYKLTLAGYADMLAAQGGCCAVCRSTGGRELLHVDHDHRTGKVRGLLCRKCNVFLGMVGDSPERIRLLIAYIQRS